MPSVRSLWLTALLLLGLGAPALAEKPPSFSMKDLNGTTHTLADYRGQWVIVNFWATWCPPCLEELPDLIAFHKANPDDVVLGVNFEEIEPKYLRAFVKEQAINYPVLPIGDNVMPGLEPINALPTTIIISPEGKVIAKHTGPLTQQMLEDFLRGERLAAARRMQAAN